MTLKEILKLDFYSHDLSNRVTIKQYFKRLLSTLWEERDEFSGKRPLGNSDWEYDLYVCLIENNVIEGNIDKHGEIDDNFDYAKADEIIKNVIQSM